MQTMNTLNDYTPNDIMNMDYNHLIGIVKETNRPPGGIHSLLRIVKNTLVSSNKIVLEIGTSTGFTAIELARLIGCTITAIDINEESLKEAAFRAKAYDVLDKIKFLKMDATETNFQDKSFDMIFCGNVTSLIPNHQKALAEYCRILKNGGYLVAIPMYYLKTPPKELVSKVSQAIQVNITPLYKNYWIDLFNQNPLEILLQEDYSFDYLTDNEIESFTTKILARPHIDLLKNEVKKVLKERYREFMFLFRDNLSKMGYTILILRKEVSKVDSELFTSSRI